MLELPLLHEGDLAALRAGKPVLVYSERQVHTWEEWERAGFAVEVKRGPGLWFRLTPAGREFVEIFGNRFMSAPMRKPRHLLRQRN